MSESRNGRKEEFTIIIFSNRYKKYLAPPLGAIIRGPATIRVNTVLYRDTNHTILILCHILYVSYMY